MLLAGHQSKLIHWRISLGKSAPTIFEASRNVSWRAAYDRRNYRTPPKVESKKEIKLKPKQVFKI